MKKQPVVNHRAGTTIGMTEIGEGKCTSDVGWLAVRQQAMTHEPESQNRNTRQSGMKCRSN